MLQDTEGSYLYKYPHSKKSMDEESIHATGSVFQMYNPRISFPKTPLHLQGTDPQNKLELRSHEIG